MTIVNGLNQSQIEALLRARASFEVVGLRGDFMKGIKLVEAKIESQGMKCRVRSDVKSSLAQGGVIGIALGVISAPITATMAGIGVAASVGHTLATYNPDYEIIKDYINKKLHVIYKK